MTGVKSVLSQQNAVAFLVYIYENGGITKPSYVQEVISNFNSVKNIAYALEKEKLITITEISGKDAHTRYELTLLGMEIAKNLKIAEDRLKGIVPEEPITNCSSPSSTQNMVR